MELADPEDEPKSPCKACRGHFTSYVPELVIALLNTSVTMVTIAALPQILKGTCYSEYGPGHMSCLPENIKETSEDFQVQTLAAYYTSIFRLLISIPPLFIGLFCGTTSDRIGKKVPVLLTIAGILLGQLIFIHSGFFKNYTIVLILAGAFVLGISGNVETVGICLLAYASTSTRTSHRTFRIGLLTGSSFFGKFLGAILVGICLDRYSFHETYMIAIVISTASFFLCLFCLEENPTIDQNPLFTDDTRLLIVQQSDTNNCSPLTDICEFVSKRRDIETYLCLICITAVSFLGTSAYSGTWDILNLIIKRPELGMEDATYGFLKAVGAASNALVLIIFQGIMFRMCQVSDIAICVSSSLACILRFALLYCFDEAWAIWATTGIQGLGVMLNSASISLASKQVSPEEQGKLMAMLQVPQFIGNAFGTLLYACIYATTFDYFPRCVFLVATCTHVLLLILIGAFAIWKRIKR